MHGDSGVIRRRADQLREQGVDVRALADRLVGQAESTGWSGRAGDALQRRIQDRAASLRAAADGHADAAEALAAHAAEVERVTEAIATRELQVRRRVDEAAQRVAGVRAAAADDAPGVERRADPADEALLALDLPPRGHRAWLDLELPADPER